MFTALVRLGRELAAQGRRSPQECERWERAVQQLVMPTDYINLVAVLPQVRIEIVSRLMPEYNDKFHDSNYR